MNIRPRGLDTECRSTAGALTQTPGLTVVSVVGPYPDRGTSALVRWYLNAHVNLPPEPASGSRSGRAGRCPHPGNIRASLGDLTELAESIRAQGILQPLVLRQHPQQPGHYQVLAGYRRLEAARLAHRDQVPVVVRQITGPSAAASTTAVMLAENLIRVDLTAVEKAEAIGGLRDGQGLSAARIAELTGLTRSTICYYLSLLDLDDASRERVASGAIGVGDAIAAVRQARAATRDYARPGSRPQQKVTVAAEHFGCQHPLADLARAMCAAAGHTAPKTGRGRPGEGEVACAACWEAVIRADERTTATAGASR